MLLQQRLILSYTLWFILGDRLFELKGALKKALRVEERTQEAMKEKLKPKRLLRRGTKSRKS